VMSINWRASLVPAAAVIPAPRAYTNIAAVKTPVVCHRVAGLLGGPVGRARGAVCGERPTSMGRSRRGPAVRSLGQNPQWYAPAPDPTAVRETRPVGRFHPLDPPPPLPLPKGSFSGVRGGHAASASADTPAVEASVPRRDRASTTGAHRYRHRGKLSVLQASCLLWLDACPWNVRASTERGMGVVLALESAQGNVVPGCPLSQSTARETPEAGDGRCVGRA